MDRQETLNTFHWHRWVASQKGSVTISAEDMDSYCVLINNLIRENERLSKEVKYWEAEAKEARADIDQSTAEARADTVRKMLDKVKEFAYYDCIETGIDRMVIDTDDIDQIAKEIFEGAK